jgi:carbon storage regulator CsrA
MLVLARKSRESVVIAANDHMQELVRVTVIDVCEGRVKLGFQADNAVAIHREEVWERVCAERLAVKPK